MISGQYFSSMPAASAWLDPKPLPPLPPLPTASPGAEEEQAVEVEVEVSDDWYADDDEWNAARLGEAPGDDQQPAAAYVAPRAPYRKENYRPNRQRSGPRRRVLRGGAENSEGERSGTESEESEDEECQLLRLKTVSNHRRLRKDEECELLRLREILRGGNLLRTRRREDGDPSAGQLSAKTSVSPSVKIETELDAELDSHSAKQAAFDLAGFAGQPAGPAAGKKRLMIEDRETVDARHAPDLTVHGNSDSEPDPDFMNRLHDPVNMAHHSFVQHVARLAAGAKAGGDPIDAGARFERGMLALFDGSAATTSARRRHCLRTALKMYTEELYEGQLLKAQLRAQEARFARVRTYREAVYIAELQTQLEDAQQLTRDMLQAGSAQAPGPQTRQRSKMRKLF
jgi:hypothetical protein